MKNEILKLVTIAALLVTVTSACKKELIKDASQNEFDNQIESAAIIADSDLNADDVITDENSETFEMETEGINPNYLVDETDFDADEAEGVAGGSNTLSKRKRIANKSFIYCLRKLDLGKDQVRKIRYSLVQYRACKSSAVQRARAIYNNIRAPYIVKFKRLVHAVRNGKITKREFVKAVQQLRVSFVKELRKAQLKAKLHIALKTCYKKMLRNVHGVLSAKQWSKFVSCLH